MTFELLVSTMYKNTDEVLAMLKKSNVKCNALVVVQGDEEGYQELKQGEQSIRIFFSKDRGLSKSRNLALKNCKADFGYIMDDDVVLNEGAIEEIINNMLKENTDIGTAFFTYEDGRLSIPSHKTSFIHNYLTAAKVASIEICVRIKPIHDKNISFDEKFGLGTELPSGEEYIFITDCLKDNLKVKYYPVNIGTHPNVTSGQNFYSSPEKTLAKREMLKRIFLWKSPVYILAFWIKKLPEVIKAGYGFKFTKTMLQGPK